VDYTSVKNILIQSWRYKTLAVIKSLSLVQLRHVHRTALVPMCKVLGLCVFNKKIGFIHFAQRMSVKS